MAAGKLIFPQCDCEMVDRMSAEKRSYVMSRIRSKNTGLELAVRRMVFDMGYRYRLYAKGLPGRPDLVFPGKKKVIFVHGCFWHQHQKCPMGKPPASNLAYWGPKLARTAERDHENMVDLKQRGWQVLVIWECQMQVPTNVKARIRHFLGSRTKKNIGRCRNE